MVALHEGAYRVAARYATRSPWSGGEREEGL
jgi:hypothetical protein